MALTRKFLTALDIDNAKIEEIITAHTETVEALKSEISEYKAKINNFDDISKELRHISLEIIWSAKNLRWSVV